MKTTRRVIQFALAMLLLSSDVSNAQSQLSVSLTNGQTDAFYVSDIRSIKFINNTMNITENNGTQSSWLIADIIEYSFKGSNSIGQTLESTSNYISIFPNPVSDILSIEYWSLYESNINIELLDVSGKIVRSVFEGFHQGKKTYTWTKDLPNGMYLCRIVSKNKSITKPFVIQ
jgi:hypothetical protein